MKAVNEASKNEVASDVVEAVNVLARMKGLLGRSGMAQGSCMLFRPCNWIHTIGMRFPIDVLFLDEGNVVLKAYEEVRPGRINVFALKARCALELPAGTIARTGTKEGDKIDFK